MENKLNFLVINALVFFTLLIFISIVFNLTGLFFIFEFMAAVLFILILFLGIFLLYREKRAGWAIVGMALIFLIIDVFLISLIKRYAGADIVGAFIFSLAGLAFSIFSLRRGVSMPAAKESGQSYYNFIDKMESKEPNVEKTYEPGKYVASKKANKYHTAKCDWALRINKENQMWFDSKEDAELKGLEADKCVV